MNESASEGTGDLVKRLCLILLLSVTASAATCKPPKGMAQGRVPNTPLLKYDCAATQEIWVKYQKRPLKPAWIEMYVGANTPQTLKAIMPIARAFHEEGYTITKDKTQVENAGAYMFSKGKVILGGHFMYMQIINNKTEKKLFLLLAGR